MDSVRQSSGTLHSERRDPALADNGPDHSGHAAGRGNGVKPLVVGEPVASDLSVLVEPRLLTEDDVPWLYHLMRKKYSHRYDAITTEGWYRNLVLKQPMVYLPQRTQNAFCISMLTFVPWLPAEFECTIVCICADDGAMWEAVKLMRVSIDWARKRRCTYWRMSSETETDLAAFAHRIGAEEISPRYTIRL